MKEKLLILGAMVALCCSCAGNSVLLREFGIRKALEKFQLP